MKIATKAAVASGEAAVPATACRIVSTPGAGDTISTCIGFGAAGGVGPVAGGVVGFGRSGGEIRETSAIIHSSLPKSGLLAAKSLSPLAFCATVA